MATPLHTPNVPANNELTVLHSAAFLVVGAVVWFLETRRRHCIGLQSTNTQEMQIASFEEPFFRTLLERASRKGRALWPEACGLAIVVAVAGAMLAWNTNPPKDDPELWQQIQEHWPLLSTADSLLALRSMLRLLLLVSAISRTEEALRSPVAGEPALFLLAAAISRVLLLALSPEDVYHLDGPLGGITHVLLEVVSLGPLAFLALAGEDSCQSDRSSNFIRALGRLLQFLLVGTLSVTNHLCLGGSDQAHLDVLFTAGELFELAAATSFLLCALRQGPRGNDEGDAFEIVAHLLLPAQQLLSAYFLVRAWGGPGAGGFLEEVPALVGAGRPFELLQLGGLSQVGLYMAAGAARLVQNLAVEKEGDGLVLV